MSVTTEFGVAELRDIMVTLPDYDEAIDLDGGMHTKTFEDLGYDSLAVLEIMSEVQRRYGVRISDDVVFDLKTPIQAVQVVHAERTSGVETGSSATEGGR